MTDVFVGQKSNDPNRPKDEWQAYAYDMGFAHAQDPEIRRLDPTGICPGAGHYYRRGYTAALSALAA